MEPNLHLAQQLKKMGFDLEQMESSVFKSKTGILFEGSYFDKIPCNGLLRQYGDELMITFKITHPIDGYASLHAIEVNLYESEIPFPVVCKRYEQDNFLTKTQIIDNVIRLAKAQKLLLHKAARPKTAIKRSNRR